MKLYTNRPEFINDICDEVRLFLPNEAIVRVDDNNMSARGSEPLLSAILNCNESFISNASLSINGREHCYEYNAPLRMESELIEKRYAKRCIKIAVFRVLKKAFPDRRIPWGSLTGIRPTRLLRELIDSGGRENALHTMEYDFDVMPDKIALADAIVNTQKPILSECGGKSFDVYIGIPFCRTRCLYCSFASQLRTKKTDMGAYLAALESDIKKGSILAEQAGIRPRAFYMGGGTPTILTADELDRLLTYIENCYNVSGCEFTVEAGRPDTITVEKLRVMKAHRVTRVSVNPQTMSDATLRMLGREHTAEDITRCFDMVRQFGFHSVNADIIAGLPNESERDMENTLERIAKLAPECLTVHTLAIKRSSRLHEHMDKYALPSVETVERMVDMGREAAYSLGMIPYYLYRQKYMAGNLENVGYSTPDSICVYNIDMMEDALSIIAHGAGAMTKRVFDSGGRIERAPNPKDIDTYINKLNAVHSERERLFMQ